MKLLPRIPVIFTQAKQLSSFVNKEQEITLQTCGKFYAANNKRFLYRRGTPDGISVNVKFIDTNPSSGSNMPTVLAIHGSPGNYNEFSDLIERLNARGCRVIAPNFPNMKLTDSNFTFYHSTGEKYELLTDFLAAIGAPSFDLALMHSSGTYPTMKLWNDKPGSIRSLMWINPAGHRRIKAMKPEWFVSNLARLNMVPIGRWFYQRLGYAIAKAARVKVNTDKEHASNAVLAALTMHLAGVERLAEYAQNLKAIKTPTSYIFSDKDKLVDYEIFLELIDMLGATEENINTVNQGELIKAAEKEFDWLRVFNIQGGGHYAFKYNVPLLDSEANRLIEQVHSSARHEAKDESRSINVKQLYQNEGRAYAVNMNTYAE